MSSVSARGCRKSTRQAERIKSESRVRCLLFISAGIRLEKVGEDVQGPHVRGRASVRRVSLAQTTELEEEYAFTKPVAQ